MHDNSKSEKQPKQPSDDIEESDAVSLIIGNFGRWQLFLTFLLSLFNLPCTWHIFLPTFQTVPRNYWCSPPKHLSHLEPQIWREFSQPKNSCTILDLDWNTFTPQQIINGTAPRSNLIPCKKWTFENGPTDGTVDVSTIVSEWSLVCGRAYLTNVAETSFLLGVAFGGLVSGMLSDRYGRKTTLLMEFIVQTSIGVLISFIPWYEGYVVLRMMLGFVSVAIVFSSFVLSLELVGGVWRTVSGVSFMFPVSIGYAVCSGVAYLIKGNWRKLQLAISLPPALLLLAFWWPITESPRWLLALGRKEKFDKVIRAATRFNKLPPPTDQQIGDSYKFHQQQMASGSHSQNAGILDLFRTSNMRHKSFCLFLIWFSVYFVYYGLALNVNQLVGDLYINSALSGFVEIPALAISILVLIKLGRRWPLCLSLMIAGLACLATLLVQFLPKGSEWISTAFAMLAKLSVSASNAIMPVFTAELYPTVIRNLGVGACNAPAGMALILVSYLWMMSTVLLTLPMVILGLCGVIGGLVVLLLPETGNKPLIETITDDNVQKEECTHNHSLPTSSHM